MNTDNSTNKPITNKDPIYNPFPFLNEKSILLVYSSLADAEIDQFQNAVYKEEQDLKNALSQWGDLKRKIESPYNRDKPPTASEISQCLANLSKLAQQKAKAIVNSRIGLNSLQKAKDLETRFAKTNDGKLLNLAWKALVDTDLETLKTITTSAPNSLSGVSWQAFQQLVTSAGIEFSNCGSVERGFSGEGAREGTMVFLLGEEALRISYDRPAGSDAKEIYSIDVVRGKINRYHGRFEETLVDGQSTTNADSEAVKAMAVRIATKIRKHYQNTASPQGT
jgi:hypothetical protein